MGDKTAISWTDSTWNPIRGCSRVSKGCENCYAEKMASRFSGAGLPYSGTITPGTKRWNGKIRLVPEALDWPLRKQKPQRIFVNSMSDLFHEGVPDEYIKLVFDIMATASELNGHTFQVLTKRPERMRDFVSRLRWSFGLNCIFGKRFLTHRCTLDGEDIGGEKLDWIGAPPKVHLGVSVENQETAYERIPILLQTPAAVRFISAEPLLGPVLLAQQYMDRDRYGANCFDGSSTLDWVIVGGESGPGARPCRVEWIRSIFEQCRHAKVPVFVKQDSGPMSGMQGRIPNEFWVQEFPA